MNVLRVVLLLTICWGFGQIRSGADERSGWLNVLDFGASGSSFQTTATTEAGSREIVVADPGDFRVGQGVMVSGAYVHYADALLFGPKMAVRRPLPEDVLEMRGYEGGDGGWLVFLLEIIPGAPPSFRWTDDLGRNWREDVPITGDWQPLSGNVQVRFKRRDWDAPYAISFHARDLLVSTIEKIEGNKLVLKHPANRATKNAVVRHCDDTAMQAAIDAAIKQRKNVFFPPGTYRMRRGLVVQNASAIVLEGGSSVETVLDISEAATPGEYTCISLLGGTDVTIRNFRMVGHSGFDARDQCGGLRMNGLSSMWGFYVKGCNAVAIRGTERVLIENCHATRMAAECFYSQSPSRDGKSEPERYTKSITYLRCSVTDSGRNAFNNNDGAENTSVLHCRVVDVGGCSWEGASRFVRIMGNYVRNAGPIAMGNVRSRSAAMEELGRAQHIVADNVFEGRRHYGKRPGGFMIHAAAGASQVIVRNNIFVNFNSSGVWITARTSERDLPASNAIITGNIFDLTSLDETPLARTGIEVGAADVIVSDNQIYVRGQPDPLVTGIKLNEAAINLNIHDNLIRNCGVGLQTERAEATVADVSDDVMFLSSGRGVPWQRRQSHCYRGWNVVWFRGKEPSGRSVIEAFDPETLRFKLREPRAMQKGDRFEVFPPSANWNIHHNTITDCLKPVVFDTHGSDTTLFQHNIISRGNVTAGGQPVEILGKVKTVDNEIHGFDQPTK
ncbi:MAG: right-handed parallel beta-helix repeat-containing protein [Verrucomicrobiae bacterium]|nr:right-handed parallel beta-helix repeat-containing protein [Verrucomicrobiae bacterium]